MRDTVIDRFVTQVEARAGQPALYFRQGDAWHSWSWAEYGQKARAFAGALIARGLEPGERINICGFNCPEWVIASVGAMIARNVPAGIYHTDSAEQMAYIAKHSGARVLVLADLAQWEKARSILDELEHLCQVVMIREADAIDDPRVVSWEDFLAGGAGHQAEVDQRIKEIQEDELATLIYTSGTTGAPKGVMLSHNNLAITANMAFDVVGNVLAGDTRGGPGDCVVSYLPLSHIAEQMFSIHLALTLGYPVYFAESVDKVRDALVEARPTLFFAVPRVWEKFRAALEPRLNEATGVKAAVVRWSREVGVEAGHDIVKYGAPRGVGALRYRVARRLFFQRVAAQVGLDRLRLAISAAAPIGDDVLEFFMSLGIVIREIYGQSEGSGPTTMNYPRAGMSKFGTVGRAVPGVDIMTADDGEILVRGPNVFMGYFNEPEKTAETLVDGWLYSGDIGSLDADGFLTITDRKKNLIITSGGKNIPPAPIESRLRELDIVSQALVVGEGRKYLAALLTLDPELAADFARQHDLPTDLRELADHPEFLVHIQAHIDHINQKLARAETLKRFVVLPDEFTEESGELTPTRKLKRRVILERYAGQITSMYS
ncbi:long-chain fatty acid--CoA ligase [Lujinxingia litoralis]|uniref:Long-chain fatty acid--CoA ligase n=1 Tax=Lujinxingia litoralis TaxID=2211119 RepID=A0A328C6X4_9DELT|nr:long-chain fatty acid--CoA ligase [Lujinxingia litoralis]RAL21227.1 long-chain fatty acid--CoA ligase [Lujinxingia litoralis]